MIKNNIILILFIPFFFFSCSPTEKIEEVKNAEIDLSNWNFEEQGVVDLRGKWEFYWNEFYTSDDFKEQNIVAEDYINVPSLWNKHEIDTGLISNEGFGTLRLKIKLSENHRLLALRIGRIETAFRLYINGEMIKSVGSPGKTKETTTPNWNPTNAVFYCDSSELEIIIHIANFHHKKIGTSGTILLGNQETITKKSNRTNYFNIFLIGVLLIIALYHFGLFTLRREDKPSLLFAIFCVSIAFISFFFGDVVMGKIFPWISWRISINFLFFSYYAGVFSFTLFIYSVFKKHFNKIPIIIFLSIQVIFAIITIFTPVKIFTHLMIPYQLSAIITLLFLLVGLIKASFKKEEGAFFSALALIIFIGTAVNDILLDQILINSIYLLSFGTFMFVFLQSFTISLRFSRLFSTNKRLTSELEEINQNLEQKVSERTAKVEQQKEELRAQAESLQDKNEELNQQKEELTAQSETLEKANREITEKNVKIEKQNEDITHSIIYAQRIQKALLPSENLFGQYFSEYFIFYKPRDIVSGDFYWMNKVNKHLLVAVADCTGHGVPGAFVSMLGISLLNEIVRYSDIYSTKEVLEVFREKMKISLNQNSFNNDSRDGMDIAFCSINTETNELEYSGANNPLYIIRKKTNKPEIRSTEHRNIEIDDLKLYHIEPNRQPIGVYFNEHPFTSQKIKLLKDDVIIMLTDGYHDQFSEENLNKYYSKNLKRLLLSCQNKDMKTQKDILVDEFDKWKGNNRQFDDILIMGLKV